MLLVAISLAAVWAGVALLLVTGDGPTPRASRADAANGVRAGSAELERPAAGAPDALVARSAAKEESDASNALMARSIPLGITVVNERRLAVRGARCRLLRTYAGAREEEPELHSVDGFGHLELSVEPGEYELVVTAARHRVLRDRLFVEPGARRFDYEAKLIGDGQLFAWVEGPGGRRPFSWLDRSLVRERTSVIATRAEPEHRSVRALAAIRADANCFLTPGRANSEEEGRLEFVLAVPPERPLWIHVALGDQIVATEVVHAGTKPVVFRIDDETFLAASASALATLLDAESGKPVAGARFSIAGSSDESDAADEVVLERLPPGPAEWHLSCPGREERRGRVELFAGERAELGTLALDSAARIEGRIVDEHGRPVDARVVLVPDVLGLDALHAGLQARGELDLDHGRFVFEHAGRKRYRVLVRDERWCAEPIEADTRAGDAGGLVLHAARGSAVHLRTSAGATMLLVLDEHGRIACFDELRTDVTLALTPGRYTVRAELDGRVVERAFDCSASDVELDLAR